MLSTLLKALGISMTPEAIAELETLLPRIPGMVRDAWNTINENAKETDARLRAIEERLDNAGLQRPTIELGVCGAINGNDDCGIAAGSGGGGDK